MAITNKQTNVLAPLVYDGTDAQLEDALFTRGLFVPSLNGKFDRKRAIRALQDWEVRNPVESTKMCKVIFHDSRHPSASRKYAQGTLNGKKYVMPYETEVVLPKNFLEEVMDRAEEHSIVTVTDGKTPTSTTRTIKTKIYPYSFLGYVEPTTDTDTEQKAVTDVAA